MPWAARTTATARTSASRSEAIDRSSFSLRTVADSITEATDLSYTTTLDALTVYYDAAFPTTIAAAPLLVCMHGWGSGKSIFTQTDRQRYAGYGFFAVFPDMRGRGSSGGSLEASCREIYDIVDCVNDAIARYPTRIDTNQIHIAGWSGGGGNVMNALTKFPAFFTSGVSCFGISDYGHDGTDGWWYTTASYQAALTTRIADRTAEGAAEKYIARRANLATRNLLAPVKLYHDSGDSITTVVQSQNFNTNAIADGTGSLVSYTETTSANSPRALHSDGIEPYVITQFESLWVPDMLNRANSPPTLPTSGTWYVAGYVVTDTFELWLGPSASGQQGSALLAFNTATGAYTVTPQSATPLAIKLIVNDVTVAEASISEATIYNA